MMLILSDKDIQHFRRVRSAARSLLLELDQLPLDPAPERPRKRQAKKPVRVEEFERNYAAGKWGKPARLKKSK